MALPLLPLLFMGGSIAANSIAANKQGNAIAAANNAERARQKRFDDESFALNNASQERFDTLPQGVDDRAGELSEMFAQTSEQQPVNPVITVPQSTSSVVTSRGDAAMGQAKADTDARAKNLGGLRAFGDVLGGISRDQGRDAGQLGLIGSMRRGSQAVLPMELQAAQSAGGGWRLLGDLLSAGGGMMGPGGMLAGGLNGNSAVFNPLFGGKGLGGFV